MIKSSFNASGKTDFTYQINRDGEKLFVWVDEDEDEVQTSHDVTGSTWEFFIKRFKGDRVKTLSLTLGAGVSFPAYGTNQILVEITAAQSLIEEGEYYYELYDITNKRTWISGKIFFSYDPQE